MSYGTPASDTYSAKYSVAVNHSSISGAGGLIVTFGRVSTESATESEFDQIFQDFVDLIDGSTDFTLSDTVKRYQTTQTVTPT